MESLHHVTHLGSHFTCTYVSSSFNDTYPHSPPAVRIIEKVRSHEYLDKDNYVIHPAFNAWSPSNNIAAVFEYLISDFIEKPLQKVDNHPLSDGFVIVEEKYNNPPPKASIDYGWTQEDVENVCRSELGKLTDEEIKHLNQNEKALMSFCCSLEPIKELNGVVLKAVQNGKAIAQSNVSLRNNCVIKIKEYEEKRAELCALEQKLMQAKEEYRKKDSLNKMYDSIAQGEVDSERKLKEAMRDFSSGKSVDAEIYLGLLLDNQRMMIYKRKVNEYLAKSQI